MALDHLTEIDAAEDDAALQRFHHRRDEMGPWGDALLFSRGALRLTGEELLAFWEEYLALLQRYRPDDPEADRGDQDARRVLVRFLAFPDVD